jgi:hypothetical protein
LRRLGIRRKPDSSTKTRWAPSRAAFFYTRPILALPVLDGRLITLERAALGLLIAPAQVMQQTPDVIAVIVNTEVLTNQVGDARAGPQLGGVAVRHGAAHQELPEPLALPARELGGAARRSAHLEDALTLAPPSLSPAHHGARMTVHAARHFVKREPLVQKPQCLATPVREDLCGTLGSHPFPPGARRELLHYLCINQ